MGKSIIPTFRATTAFDLPDTFFCFSISISILFFIVVQLKLSSFPPPLLFPAIPTHQPPPFNPPSLLHWLMGPLYMFLDPSPSFPRYPLPFPL